MKRKKNIRTNVLAYRLLKRKFRKIRKAVLMVMVLFFSVSAFARVNTEIKHKFKERHLIVNKIRRSLILHDVKHHKIVLKQAILETGWFSCTTCSLQKNNLFGFRYKKKYLEFETIEESVEYYKDWQDRHYEGGNYYDFLTDIGYATNPAYIKLLKSVKIK